MNGPGSHRRAEPRYTPVDPAGATVVRPGQSGLTGLARLAALLEDLVAESPRTRGAVLLTADGNVLASHGLDPLIAGRIAGASAAIACGRWANRGVPGLTPPDDDTAAMGTVVSMDDDELLFVFAVAPGRVLAVATARDQDGSFINCQALQFAASISPAPDAASTASS